MKANTKAIGHSLTTLCACAAVLLLTGCIAASVPRTSITGSLAGQPFTLEAPKDVDLRNLEIKAQTNGSVIIKVESLTAKMNPEVITTTAAAQRDLVQTVGAEIRATAAALPKP